MKYELIKTELDEQGCSKYLDLRESQIQGYGLFASRPLQRGSILWLRSEGTNEEFMSTEEFEKMTPEEKKEFLLYGYQIKGGYAYPPKDAEPEKSDYWNHSCNGNSGIHYRNGKINGIRYDRDDIWVALIDISKGEEVTVDYATFETSPDEVLYCNGLNEKDCRKIVTGNDWKIPRVQKQYKGHFSTEAQELINRYNKNGVKSREHNGLVVMEQDLEL